MPLRIGETFAGYRVLRLLGSGGMGEVYLVQHPRLPRQEALKVLRPDISSDTSFRERFIREADLAAGLRHPHIVGIHDRGEYEGQLWIAMDYIDGTDAAHLIQQRYPAGMPAELAIPIITAVASALDYAHKKGLLHRDVKPANIIVSHLDSDDQSVFLADFGIARPIDDISGITTTNMTVGTVAYAAPEQLLGEEMDGRADEYALAATTYQLLTGLPLFTHSNPAVVISRHLNMTPPTLGDHRPDLAGLDGALRVALAKDPNDRYPSCTAFAHALTKAGAPATSGRTTASEPVAAQIPAPAVTEERSTPSATKDFSTERPLPLIEADESNPPWSLIVSTLAIIVLLAAVAVAVVVRPWQHDRASNGSTDTPPTTATTSATTTSTTTTSSTTSSTSGFAYQPLWPFAAQQEADSWLREDAPHGISSWHADPEATALNFTQDYLGFSEIDRVTHIDDQGEEAWINVGYTLPNGEDATAATIHLARYGTDEDAPWEVVGTEDAMLTVTAPPYGSSVGPVVYAGGAITGVDEAVHVQVRQSTQQLVLGDFCCVQTGGNPGSWSAQVRVSGAQPGPLTMVVWTGGHVARVEQFAITGLQAK